MSDTVSMEQHGLQPLVILCEERRPILASHRFRCVAACFALIMSVALLSTASNVAMDKVADILCCDGCCRTSLIQPKLPIDQPQSATILHLSGSTEIDYTRNGHRVPLHMETALNELDHIERHVKLGLPKYLQESAAQREADLVDHKFEQDLEGSSDKEVKASVAVPVLPPVPKLAKAISSKSSITQAVAEASRMEEGLRRKDKEEEGRIIAPSTRELSRDHLEAEKEADDVSKFAKSMVGSPDAPKSTAKSSSSAQKEAAAKSAQSALKLNASPALQKEAAKKRLQARPTIPVASKTASKPLATPQNSVAPNSLQKDEHAERLQDAKKTQVDRRKALRGPDSDVDPEEWARLRSIQSRIEKLIGGYTGGASRHSSFFKHFDDEDMSSPAELSSHGQQESAVQLAEDEAARDKKAFLNL